MCSDKKKSEKMSKGDWIGLIIVLCLFFGMIGGAISYFVWENNYKEISSYNYDNVKDWSKKFPDVHVLTKEVTWKDNLIDKSEFKQIERLANSHLVEAIREVENDYPEIDSYEYQRVNDWAHESPEIQLMVREMTQNDDLIDDEFNKIERVVHKNWVQKARGELE